MLTVGVRATGRIAVTTLPPESRRDASNFVTIEFTMKSPRPPIESVGGNSTDRSNPGPTWPDADRRMNAGPLDGDPHRAGRVPCNVGDQLRHSEFTVVQARGVHGVSTEVADHVATQRPHLV